MILHNIFFSWLLLGQFRNFTTCYTSIGIKQTYNAEEKCYLKKQILCFIQKYFSQCGPEVHRMGCISQLEFLLLIPIHTANGSHFNTRVLLRSVHHFCSKVRVGKEKKYNTLLQKLLLLRKLVLPSDYNSF